MKAVTRFRRAALTGALVLTGLTGGPAVMAQGSPTPDFEPDYFESMLIGYEIEISGSDFVIDDVYQQNYETGENELVYIVGDTGLVEISFFDDEDSPEETIDLWIDLLDEELDEMEIVDSGVDGDVTWSYVVGSLDGDVFNHYIQIQEDVEGNVDMLESILTVDGMLVDSVEAAQTDITIDGDSFMDDVDLDELQELSEGGSFRDGGTSGDDSGGDTADDDGDEENQRERSRERDRDVDDTDDPGTSDDDRIRDRSRDRNSPDDDTDPDATEEVDDAEDDGR